MMTSSRRVIHVQSERLPALTECCRECESTFFKNATALCRSSGRHNPIRRCESVVSMRDLGISIDFDVTRRTHVVATVRSCFAALHQSRRVSQYASTTLVRAPVQSSTTSTTAAHCWSAFQLQSAFSASDRLVFSARRSEHAI